MSILIGGNFEDEIDILPYTEKGVDFVIFGCIVVVLSVYGLYAVIAERKRTLAKFCIAFIFLIILQILVASVILYRLDNSARESKDRVAQTFNRAGLKSVYRIDNIQRSVSISMSDCILEFIEMRYKNSFSPNNAIKNLKIKSEKSIFWKYMFNDILKKSYNLHYLLTNLYCS